MHPNITLEQWRALLAVVEAGGYAQAAVQLNKTQSSITYAVQKIESLLNIRLFEIKGRKAQLTPTGQMLYQRAKFLLDEAIKLEQATRMVSAGWEAEIALAVEILFPTSILLRCLEAFGKKSPHTRIEVIESVLGGTTDALIKRHVDIAISPHIPQGFMGTPLLRLNLRPVAHVDHPLHQLNKMLSLRDLRHHRHLVVRDSGLQRDRHKVSTEVPQRWTVSHLETSIAAVCGGYGFSWLPVASVQKELDEGILKVLPLEGGHERWVELYLIIADPDAAGPAVRYFAETIKHVVMAQQS